MIILLFPFQAGSGLVVSNTVLADNHAGILAMIKGPSSLSHKTSEKSVKVENSLIVGMSPDFECGVDDKVSALRLRGEIGCFSVSEHYGCRGHFEKLRIGEGGQVISPLKYFDLTCTDCECII